MEAFLNKIWRRLPLSPKVQILSDLHLEVGWQYSTYTFPASAPFLLLAGDIGRLVDYDGYLKFLETHVFRYEKVFLVLGNHEFYGLDYESGLNEARRLSEEPSLASTLVLLSRARWDDPSSDLTIRGSTLWSAIPESAYGAVEVKVSDYKKIKRWTVQRHNEVHAEEIAWLRNQVAQVASLDVSSKRQLLVVTHHAPCVESTSRPEHVRNPWTSFFATDLLDQGKWDGVNTWVFGHTHYSTDFLRNNTRVVANQRGYILTGSTVQRDEGKKKNAHSFDAAMAITL
ncbi:Metallo-dependent phosphatase-like protein [Phialemonium atrogriseum]|uniref:Metallo-dependent phosphatase-like protein n=1 Tax=Phialemonium atrogriseum TaxID=1093897 RepID=A0AAJ0FGN4_9PEZI|nr:Metallo-dependent phosphatase-like protein [Phialemonium atrogriseum]KAK1767786.1 Metallo-dependent phosphatase-like protein [Phialemonium atrogriseum]